MTSVNIGEHPNVLFRVKDSTNCREVSDGDLCAGPCVWGSQSVLDPVETRRYK